MAENTVVKLRSTKLYQSPIALKGLEFLLDIKKTRKIKKNQINGMEYGLKKSKNVTKIVVD